MQEQARKAAGQSSRGRRKTDGTSKAAQLQKRQEAARSVANQKQAAAAEAVEVAEARLAAVDAEVVSHRKSLELKIPDGEPACTPAETTWCRSLFDTLLPLMNELLSVVGCARRLAIATTIVALRDELSLRCMTQEWAKTHQSAKNQLPSFGPTPGVHPTLLPRAPTEPIEPTGPRARKKMRNKNQAAATQYAARISVMKRWKFGGRWFQALCRQGRVLRVPRARQLRATARRAPSVEHPFKMFAAMQLPNGNVRYYSSDIDPADFDWPTALKAIGFRVKKGARVMAGSTPTTTSGTAI